MFATIDIGTNSILLLIGQILPDGKIKIICDEARISRLGKGLCNNRELKEESIKHALEILKEYRGICLQNNVKAVSAVATEVLRSAANKEDFLSKLKNEIGLEVDVLTPEQEAFFTFLSSEHDFGSDTLVTDIGGGSTEIIWCNKTKIKECKKNQYVSIPIGSVFLTDHFIKTDPISYEEFQDICSYTDQQLNHITKIISNHHVKKLIATAGTATTLASINKKIKTYNPKEINGTVLKMLDIQVIIGSLKEKNINQRKKIMGMQSGREDIILAGAIILDRLMRKLGYDTVTISNKGLRWGVFLHKFANSIKKLT